MTLRHIVLMRFPDGPDAAFIAAMHQGVEAMLAIPEVEAGSGGSDVSGKDENYHYAIVLDFADRDAYERYRVHPVHQAFIADFMRGRTIDKVRLQYDLV